MVTKCFRALGRLVGFRRDGVIHYAGTDHLGSTVRVLDAAMNALDSPLVEDVLATRHAGLSRVVT